MYTIISFDCKFETNRKNIEKTLRHFGLRKIQPTLYVGELDLKERETLVKNINENIRENDSILVIPICQSGYLKKESCGREIKFKNDLYRVY